MYFGKFFILLFIAFWTYIYFAKKKVDIFYDEYYGNLYKAIIFEEFLIEETKEKIEISFTAYSHNKLSNHLDEMSKKVMYTLSLIKIIIKTTY